MRHTWRLRLQLQRQQQPVCRQGLKIRKKNTVVAQGELVAHVTDPVVVTPFHDDQKTRMEKNSTAKTRQDSVSKQEQRWKEPMTASLKWWCCCLFSSSCSVFWSRLTVGSLSCHSYSRVRSHSWDVSSRSRKRVLESLCWYNNYHDYDELRREFLLFSSSAFHSFDIVLQERRHCRRDSTWDSEPSGSDSLRVLFPWRRIGIPEWAE